MTRERVSNLIAAAASAALVGGLVFAKSACTPAQMQVVEPIAKNGGLVCFAVPDSDKEVCAKAAAVVRAAYDALQEFEEESEPSAEPSSGTLSEAAPEASGG